MKRKGLLYFSVVFLCLLASCYNKQNSNNNYQFTAKPIVKTIGNIDVMVDPNVEMMMVIGRLAKIPPYSFDYPEPISYLNNVDEYFNDYRNDLVISEARRNKLTYYRLPEFGMYLKNDISGFTMKLNNKNFITSDNIPAKNLFYRDKEFIKAVRDFRIKSNFDTFFIQNNVLYEKMIERNVAYLKELKFDIWLKDFYGKEDNENLCLYLTYLTGGGNFGISFRTPDGKIIPRAVIMDQGNKLGFIFLLAHEFSHPKTLSITEELYKNEAVKSIFDKLYLANIDVYNNNGYGCGKTVLNETINQACANKFLEEVLPESGMEYFNEKEIKERQKMIYVPQIAEFLDNYENNRKKYKTLENFVPELEKFVLTLE